MSSGAVLSGSSCLSNGVLCRGNWRRALPAAKQFSGELRKVVSQESYSIDNIYSNEILTFLFTLKITIFDYENAVIVIL